LAARFFFANDFVKDLSDDRCAFAVECREPAIDVLIAFCSRSQGEVTAKERFSLQQF